MSSLNETNISDFEFFRTPQLDVYEKAILSDLWFALIITYRSNSGLTYFKKGCYRSFSKSLFANKRI